MLYGIIKEGICFL